MPQVRDARKLPGVPQPEGCAACELCPARRPAHCKFHLSRLSAKLKHAPGKQLHPRLRFRLAGGTTVAGKPRNMVQLPDPLDIFFRAG
jgi:hypothetical protein